MLTPIDDLDAYVATRTSWHALAERVLAPARHSQTGRIGLRPSPGGVTTGRFGEDDRSLALDGRSLVVAVGGAPARHDITTLGAAATLAGVDVTAPIAVYTATTPDDPDRKLPLDDAALNVLAEWFAFGDAVLHAWRDTHGDETPSAAQLWPEHFDLALDLGADDRRANYGASPGDGGHQAPYLYVGPWNPDGDPFWNAGTYARLGYDALVQAADPAVTALDFFAAGHAVASKHTATS